jgi:hypothetical protein
MKVTVITTIAQHYRGAKLHLQNLKWAFGENANIIVQHFKSHQMPEIKADYRAFDANPYEFYFFWDKIEELLDIDCDFFVFTEQDILITSKPEYCDHIKLSFTDNYLSVFNFNRKKLYPRIWEGYTFIPGWMVRKAIDENISFGNHVKKSLDWNLNDLYTSYKDWVKIQDYIEVKGRQWHEGDFDTMFEFSLFCFLNNFKWKSNCVEGYHISKDAVHFRGIDRLCFDCRDIYENLQSIYNPSPDRPDVLKHYQEMVNDCAAILLLSGVHSKSDLMKRLIRYPLQEKRLLRKLKQLDVHANEWMDEQELDSLKWAIFILETNYKIY